MNDLTRYVADTLTQDEADVRERRESSLPPPTCWDRLNAAVLALPPCGCTVTGRGSMPFPIRIKFCERHAATGDGTPTTPGEAALAYLQTGGRGGRPRKGKR